MKVLYPPLYLLPVITTTLYFFYFWKQRQGQIVRMGMKSLYILLELGIKKINIYFPPSTHLIVGVHLP